MRNLVLTTLADNTRKSSVGYEGGKGDRVDSHGAVQRAVTCNLYMYSSLVLTWRWLTSVPDSAVYEYAINTRIIIESLPVDGYTKTKKRQSKPQLMSFMFLINSLLNWKFRINFPNSYIPLPAWIRFAIYNTLAFRWPKRVRSDDSFWS